MRFFSAFASAENDLTPITFCTGRNMKKNSWLPLCAVTCILVAPAQAQRYPYAQPRMMLGGDLALFRISLQDFEKVYSSRWGESYAAFAGVRLFAGNYLTFKVHTFDKGGIEGIHPISGRDLEMARWREKWYCVGLRVHPPLTRKTHSYYGFGVALFDVQEEPDLSVFSAMNQKKNDDLGSGFYLELGIEVFPLQRLAGFFEMEISSGGIHGKTGYESFSVGGFRFALGFSGWPF